MSEFPDPKDYDAQHLWVGRMLQRFFLTMVELKFNEDSAIRLTAVYLDKLLATPQPPISPDIAQMYERMGGFFAEIAARERDE